MKDKELAEEIFQLVQDSQGKAFISALFYSERSARIMRKWLKENEEDE